MEFEQLKMFGLASEKIRIDKEKSKLHDTNFPTLLHTMMVEFKSYQHKLFEELKPQLIELVFTICEKVIRQKLSDPQALVATIESLLSTYPLDEEKITIFLSPSDVIALKKKEGLLPLEGVHIASDALLSKGDVRIQTQQHILHATIERQLNYLKTMCL